MLVIVFLVMLYKTEGHVVGDVETYPHLNNPTHSCKVYEEEIDFLRLKVTFCERARKNSIDDCSKSQRKMEIDLETSNSVCLKQQTTILKQKDLLTEQIIYLNGKNEKLKNTHEKCFANLTRLTSENGGKTREIDEFKQSYEVMEDEISKLDKILKELKRRLRQCRIEKKNWKSRIRS
ncbi:unnamed protein product [Psylliodes chrysocephalus]|uniref:Uncharacterized protein n=1 Tax=Psylliodes chrysocephalus TaxID=3402493 RepID=A0A9P0CW06_9CUCU|nr:unnamed protein product [Psylliodes chrysocephala]